MSCPNSYVTNEVIDSLIRSKGGNPAVKHCDVYQMALELKKWRDEMVALETRPDSTLIAEAGEYVAKSCGCGDHGVWLIERLRRALITVDAGDYGLPACKDSAYDGAPHSHDVDCLFWFENVLVMNRQRNALAAEVRRMRESHAGGSDDWRLVAENAILTKALRNLREGGDDVVVFTSAVKAILDGKEPT